MAFSEQFLQELADRNDIVDVVGSYVRLTKRSGSNLFGLCPFHSEKTPSFSVSPDRQIYHCFGCGKGGSVINFIMEIENLSFPDAVAFLARRAGMELPAENEDAQRSRRRRERLLSFSPEGFSALCGAADAVHTSSTIIDGMIQPFVSGSAFSSLTFLGLLRRRSGRG